MKVYHLPDGTRTPLPPALSTGVWAWLALPGLSLLLGMGWCGRGAGHPGATVGGAPLRFNTFLAASVNVPTARLPCNAEDWLDVECTQPCPEGQPA